MIDVILETGEDRRQMVKNAVDRLGDDFIEKIKSTVTILIKPNLVHHEYQLASTHVDAVRGVLDAVRTHTRAKIYIGDASYHGTNAAFRHFGYTHLPNEYENVELVDLNDDAWVDGFSVKQDGSQNLIRRSKIAKEADVKIVLSPMKLHRDTSVSLGLKNWTIGTWVVPSRISATGRVWARWPWLHEEGAWAHHRSIVELWRQLPADVSIIDGVLAMEGDGPTNGSAVRMGLVLAGRDAIAVDAVASSLMGVDPSDVGHLAMAAEEGLGSIDLSRIDVPPMEMAYRSRQFVRPPMFEDRLLEWKEGKR